VPDITTDFIDEELPNDRGKQRIRVIYSRLETLAHELEGCSETAETIGGPLAQYQTTLDELSQLTGGRDYDGFMPHLSDNQGDDLVCLTKDLRVACGTLLGELRQEFLPEQEQYYRPATQQAPNTTVSVTTDIDVNQEVRVTQTLVNEIESKLEKLEESYAKDSPEHKFITTLKSKLGSVKNVANLMALMLNTAQTVGLDVSKLHIIMKALGVG